MKELSLNEKALRLIKRGRKRIASGWTQNITKKRINGKRCYCAWGSLLDDGGTYVHGAKSPLGVAIDELRRDNKVSAPPFFGSLIGFNDHKLRTQAQVVALFDRTIKRLEKQIG
jgi:hypothetical protein